MKKTKAILIALLVSALTPIARAQDKPEAELGADLVSQYVWRGMNQGHASIQPTLGIAWKGLCLEAWGSIGITDSEDLKEIDLTLTYSIRKLTLGIVDYWSGDSADRYFYYHTHSTNHIFEAFAGYDFGLASASWQTIFAGNDGLNNGGKRAYSSYFETIVPFKLATCDWEAAVGIVPYATSYYGTKRLAVTNVSLKACRDIKISDSFKIPVFGQIVANPRTEKAYFLFGLTLKAI